MPRNETGHPCYGIIAVEAEGIITVGLREDQFWAVSFATDRDLQTCDPALPPIEVLARYPQEVSFAMSFRKLQELHEIIGQALNMAGNQTVMTL